MSSLLYKGKDIMSDFICIYNIQNILKECHHYYTKEKRL